MIRRAILLSLFLPALAAANNAPCGASARVPLPASLPVPEMLRPEPTLVGCVDLVAFVNRMRQPAATAAPQPAAPASGTAYVPKTQHDNTPWRFDMNQNGRRMTADEFDAWMKAKGIRVATGKPGPAAPVAAPAAAPAAAVPAASQCVASATVSC